MLNESVIYALSHVLHQFKAQLAQGLATAGIALAPTHFKVLRLIARMTPCTAQDIAYQLQRDKAQVTRLLQELLQQAVIERIPNPHDKRSQWLSVTAHGKALLESMAAVEAQVLEHLWQGIAEPQQAQLLNTLRTMQQNLTLGK